MTATEILLTAQDVRAKLIAIRDAVPVPTPTPVPAGAQPWQARKFPLNTGQVLHASISKVINGIGGGRKHATMLHCPLNGRMYVFGGDMSGYASDADKAAGFASDDYRNDIWSYDWLTDNWRCEQTWDVADGEIHPWRPDWGMFAWDSKRKVFWYRPGGSNGAFQGGGSFRYSGSTGLNWNYAGGRLRPDKTDVPAGTLTLPDNATTRVYYDPVAHAVNLSAGQYPLYDVTTLAGKVTKCMNLRPYWMTYGVWNDEVIDCRHYADPTHLICFDPVTAKWYDPIFARAEDQILSDTTIDGRVFVHEWRAACMIYDAGKDQLIWIGAGAGLTSAVISYSFATNKWARTTKGVPQTNLNQSRFVFNELDRKIYAIEPCGSAAPNLTTMVAWVYDVDAMTWTSLPVPDCQSGLRLWTVGGLLAGTPVGGMYAMTTAMLDGDVIYFPEVTNPFLCPYGFEGDGLVLRIHKWFYKEGRFESFMPAFDATNHPHGIVTGIDPVNRLILTYGQDSGNPANPVSSLPYLYAWNVS